MHHFSRCSLCKGEGGVAKSFNGSFSTFPSKFFLGIQSFRHRGSTVALCFKEFSSVLLCMMIIANICVAIISSTCRIKQPFPFFVHSAVANSAITVWNIAEQSILEKKASTKERFDSEANAFGVEVFDFFAKIQNFHELLPKNVDCNGFVHRIFVLPAHLGRKKWRNWMGVLEFWCFFPLPKRVLHSVGQDPQTIAHFCVPILHLQGNGRSVATPINVLTMGPACRCFFHSWGFCKSVAHPARH